MLKKVNHILNIVLGSSIGVFIGHGAYLFWDYKKHPGLYAMQGAPWYTSILLYGACTAVVFIAVGVIKLIIWKKQKEL